MNVEQLQKSLKEQNPHLSKKEIDFMIVKEGLADGRKRTITETAQMFGMTISATNNLYNKILKNFNKQ